MLPARGGDAPIQVTVFNTWLLRADPERIARAATAWRAVASAERSVTGAVDQGRTGVSTWRGPYAEAYDAHRARLTGEPGGLAAAARHAEAMAGALDGVADELQRAQRELEQGRAAVRSTVTAFSEHGDQVTLTYPRSLHSAVRALLEAARTTRNHLDTALAGHTATLDAARSGSTEVAGALRGLADGSVAPWRGPDAPAGPVTIADPTAGRFGLYTGNGNEITSVRFDRGTVMVGNATLPIPAGTRSIVLHGGPGDDSIWSTGAVPDLTVYGGDGMDAGAGLSAERLQVLGGPGDDGFTLDGETRQVRGSGGPGDDRMVFGGDADTTGRGGPGNDRFAVDASAGRSPALYADGGTGYNVLIGGRAGGNSLHTGENGGEIFLGDGERNLATSRGGTTFFAGHGTHAGGPGLSIFAGSKLDDEFIGGPDRNTFYTPGRDRAEGNGPADRAYSQDDDALTGVEETTPVALDDGRAARLLGLVDLSGREYFGTAVRGIVDHLASSPVGQASLDEQSGALERHYAEGGKRVPVTEGERSAVLRSLEERNGQLMFRHHLQLNLNQHDIPDTTAATAFLHEGGHVSASAEGRTATGYHMPEQGELAELAQGLRGTALDGYADAVARRDPQAIQDVLTLARMGNPEAVEFRRELTNRDFMTANEERRITGVTYDHDRSDATPHQTYPGPDEADYRRETGQGPRLYHRPRQ